MLNGFPILVIPRKLILTTIGLKPPKDVVLDINDQKLIYKATAVCARKLSTLDQPVASKGLYLISKEKLNLDNVQISLDFRGIYTRNISVFIVSEQEISKSDQDHEYYKNYLNRFFDEYLINKGFSQNVRFFWRKDGDEENIGSLFLQRLGIQIRTVILNNNQYLLQADYSTELLGAKTVKSMIDDLVKKLNVKDWRNLPEKALNSMMFSLGGKVRTTYSIPNFSGEDQRRVYTFSHFMLNKAISDPLSDGFSLLDFHKERNRNVKDKDQPILICKSGNTKLKFIPSLTISSVSTKTAKAVSPTLSKIIQNNAKKSISFHYEALKEDYLEDLIADGIIGLPKDLSSTNLAPIIINVGDEKPIKVYKDLDFNNFYKRKKLYKSPEFEKIIIITDKNDWDIIRDFVEIFINDLNSFGLSLVYNEALFSTDLKYGGKAYFREFQNYINETVPSVSSKDLLMIIPPDSQKLWDDLRADVKKYVTIENRRATQFIHLYNIRNLEGRQKRLNNPLILQTISKMGGTPFIYQFDNILEDSIFIGIDRSRSWGDRPSVSSATAVFSNTGEFICSGTTDLDSRQDDAIKLENLEKLLRNTLDTVLKERPKVKRVVILRDSGRGKFFYLEKEAELSLEICKEKNLECVFVLCNKSADWRLLEGDPDTDVYRADQFTAVTNFGNDNEFILQTTAPLNIKKSDDRESPRTTTYEIQINSTDLPIDHLKELLARCISAMTRMNMRSWRNCRLPTPIHYADILAHFCGEIGTSWPKDLRRPLFL